MMSKIKYNKTNKQFLEEIKERPLKVLEEYKRKFLGRFFDFFDAVCVRKSFELLYFGEFSTSSGAAT